MTLIALLIALLAGGQLPVDFSSLPAGTVITGNAGASSGVTPTDVGGLPLG